jgi:PucR family transcriptional regulator, purine catabolism regulatory protein
MLAKTHEFNPAAEHIDELGVARLLAAWQGSEVLHAFAETALGPLRGVEDGQLLHTLYAYLECGGQVAATSKMLGLHRNTVAARLHRLRERLGVDLDDPNQRLALQLACRSLESGG